MAEPTLTYLVTGAAGFIGARVAALLLEAGHNVLGVDNLNDAYDPRLKRWRLTQLQSQPRFRFLEMDISDPPAVEALFQPGANRAARPFDEPFAAVINLAARAGVRPSVANPRIYYRTNTDGALNLLEGCRRYGVKKFVLASTSSLYGGHNPTPFAEDADTSRPLSPYAASKKAAETLAFTYHHLHKVDVTALRFFTVYGPAGRPDMAVFRFIRRIAEGLPITVFGDGGQERDFTYVDDIAAGAIAALRPMGFEVINLGSDRPVVLRTLIERVGQLTGQQPQIQYQPAHAADVHSTWADISRARRLLNWSPRTPFETGIERCVDWYMTNREMARSISLSDD